MNELLIETINNTDVLNDTLVADKVNTLDFVEDVLHANKTVSTATTIERLEAQRIEWETTVYRTSNQALYAILADCYAFGGELLDVKQAKARRAALVKFCKEREYKVKQDSPVLTFIVKAVFGNVDRRRISTYSLVLREAQRSKVLPTNLAQWIENERGIQEIRLGKSATFVSAKQKAELGQAQLDALNTIATVKADALSELADAEFIGADCVLVAEQQADGSFAIKALLRNPSVVNAAYTAVYAQQKAVTDVALKEQKAANDANGVLNDVAA